MPAQLCGDRLLQWAAGDPGNDFAQASAARAPAAAGRHGEALAPLRRWLFRDPANAEANALLSESYGQLGRPDLAAKRGRRARRAALLDLTAPPGFVAIAVCAKIRDFARAFREAHGCPYHLEASAQTLIHFHPSRTGGTSLRDGFRNLYDADEVFVFGDFREPYLKSRQQLIDASPEQRRRFRFASVHHALPAHDFFAEKYAYFTFLRDPIDTAVSWYHWHVKNRDLDPEWIDADIKNGLSLAAYAENTLATNNGNLLCRWLINLDTDADLSNRYRGLPAEVWEMSDAELTERAERALDRHFVFTGLTEFFDASLFILCLVLGGGRIPLYEWRGSSGSGPAIDALGADIRATLEAANRADSQLLRSRRQHFLGRYGDAVDWFNAEMAPFQAAHVNHFKAMIGTPEPL